MSDQTTELLRKLPAVDAFLSSDEASALVDEFGAGLVKRELRRLLDGVRKKILSGAAAERPTLSSLAADLKPILLRLAAPEGRRAINATGIILHTGLGRAPLCGEAIEALKGCAQYTILQTSIDTGGRSKRDEKIEQILCDLTGCEAATVVNNNAAATLLILNAVAAGREVIISRGQLIEIGGSFRLPEVMAQSGCALREVGATNRTHLRDYQGAVCDETAAIMHAHTSNYRIRGFSGTPKIEDIVELGHNLGLTVIDDVGSGALVPLGPYGVPDEPLISDSIAAGSDVVCFSGDKLICGPQSGIICGKADIIATVRKNPFARMFRPCKLTLAALEATLLHFVNGSYETRLPFYSMISRSLTDVTEHAEKIAALLRLPDGYTCELIDDTSFVGSGSAPDEGVPTKALRIEATSADVGDLARRLRLGLPSVFARICDHGLIVDPRTMLPDETEELAAAINGALKSI